MCAIPGPAPKNPWGRGSPLTAEYYAREDTSRLTGRIQSFFKLRPKVAAARTPLEADDSSAVEWFGAIRGEYRIGRGASDRLYFEKNGRAIATLLGGEARGPFVKSDAAMNAVLGRRRVSGRNTYQSAARPRGPH